MYIQSMEECRVDRDDPSGSRTSEPSGARLAASASILTGATVARLPAWVFDAMPDCD